MPRPITPVTQLGYPDRNAAHCSQNPLHRVAAIRARRMRARMQTECLLRLLASSEMSALSSQALRLDQTADQILKRLASCLTRIPDSGDQFRSARRARSGS
jgi:hypothetical protein